MSRAVDQKNKDVGDDDVDTAVVLGRGRLEHGGVEFFAAVPNDVAVVGDGPSDRLSEQHQLYVDELLVLASSEFDVEIRRFWGAWTRESIDAATDDAFADPEVDLVLDPDPPETRIAEVLGNYPFRDVPQAYRNLMALSEEKIRFLSTRRCRHFLAAIAPNLLSAVASSKGSASDWSMGRSPGMENWRAV